MAKPVIGLLASGRGSNAQAILNAIASGYIPASAAVLLSDNPQAPALEMAAARGLAAYALERKSFADRATFETALAGELERHNVDLVVLAGFMRLLSPGFIRRFPGRILNIHPSLLPAFPGLDAQGQAIRYGAKISGCTVHFVDEGMDSGPVILQQSVPVSAEDTAESLSQRILEVEHRLYPKAVRLFCLNRLRIDGRIVRIDSEEETIS